MPVVWLSLVVLVASRGAESRVRFGGGVLAVQLIQARVTTLAVTALGELLQF